MTTAAPPAPPEPAPDAAPARPAGYRSALSWSVAMVGGQQVLTAAVSFLLAAILGPNAHSTCIIFDVAKRKSQ